jgi:hypothetical protein
MSRILNMLHVAPDGATCNASAQQAAMLHVALPSECNVQHFPETAKHGRDWTLADVVEVERLIDLIAPRYNTPSDEIELMKTIAHGDIKNALVCFREMARQL